MLCYSMARLSSTDKNATDGAAVSASAEPPCRIETLRTPQGRSLSKCVEGKHRLTIVTGGQTGVDTAAILVARELSLSLRGWCPEGRQNENGRIPLDIPLQECGSANPAVRTELNAAESDGTLVLTRGNPTDGTPLTVDRARAHGKPYIVLSLDEAPDVEAFWTWIRDNDIRSLNIGGPRESFEPGNVQDPASAILRKLIDPTI